MGDGAKRTRITNVSGIRFQGRSRYQSTPEAWTTLETPIPEESRQALAGSSVADGVANGNKAIFGDIGPQFSRFVNTFQNDTSWKDNPARGQAMVDQFCANPSMAGKTDLQNAGAEWADHEAVVDGNLVTSRKPGDIPAFNREMIALYWHVGRTVVERQTKSGWGESVVERLAHDLRQAFPDLAGFSPRNIWRMRAFYVAWSALQKKLPQPVAELPWGHNILLLEKLARVEDRLMNVFSPQFCHSRASGNLGFGLP